MRLQDRSPQRAAASGDPLAPLPRADWNPQAAAHLLRRAGFGGTPDEIAALATLEPQAAVERLVAFPDEDPGLEAELAAHGRELDVEVEQPRTDGLDALDVLRSWWIYRLARTRHPLREKLTLYWHGHFTTAASKVPRPRQLLAQNRTLRRLGARPFRELLGALARDPAMLVYLDGRLNRAGEPNENWARELLELFTLGVDCYTQRDVAQLARVFTGWTTPQPDSGEFVFRPEDHDSGDKLLFGEPLRGRAGATGIEEGELALDRIVARPECARFLAGRLLAAFAATSWPDEVQAALAEVLRKRGLSTREALRRLFASRWFYACEQRFALHRSGVEQAIGAVRLLGVQNPHRVGLIRSLRRLGQDLFEPPSVAGWPGGRAWIQTGALLERFRLARELAGLPHTRRSVTGSPALDLEALAPPDADDRACVDLLVTRVLQSEPRPELHAALLAYVADCGERLDGAPARDVRRAKLRGLAHLLVSAPEFALA